MKRPILIITIGYILGIISGIYLKIPIIPIIFLYPIYNLYYKKTKNIYIKFYFKKSVVLILILSSIFSNLITINLNNKYKNLYNNVENVNVICKVVSNKKEKEYRNVYKVKVYSVNENKKFKNTYLYLYTSKNIDFKYGSVIKINADFEKPSVRRNYKGFSYKNYLKTIKIYGSLTLKDNYKVLKYDDINIFSRLSNTINLKIKNNIRNMLPEDTAELLIGIILGDKDNIDTDIKENFKISGISHLLAVSGAHINYIILGMTFFLSNLKINKNYRNFILLIFLVFFMFLTNFQISVIRASISAILILFSKLVYKQSDTINSMVLSLLIILIQNPFSLFNLSLQLSFGGTLGILLFYKKLYKEGNSKILNSFKSIIFVSISAQIIIFPIMLINFGTMSLSFFISNFLVTYVFALIIIMGILISILSLFCIKFVNKIAIIINVFLNLLLKISEFCTNLPFTQIYTIIPSIITIFIYYIIIYLYISYGNLSKIRRQKIKNIILYNKNKLISIILLFSITIIILKIIPGDFKIHFIDVGQGDCSFIITPNKKSILIDGGGSEDYDIGEKTLLPYLQNRKINKIDYAIISHFDSDHCNGILYLMEKNKIKNVIIGKQFEESENYNEFINLVKKNKINVKVVDVNSSNSINIERNIYIDVIWPDEESIIYENNLNNNSLVLKFNYKNISTLFTGDIEKVAEEEIVKKYKNSNLLNADILKVAHHGSKTSSTEDFINLVNPKVALIGVGENNKYGHPADQTIELLNKINCKIYRTDEMGEISISINNKGKIRIKKFLK